MSLKTKIRGIRSPVPSGHVLGRISGNQGDVELISIRDLASNLVASGGVSGGGVNPLPPLADDKIWVGNASAIATAVSVSGDATMTDTGVVTLANTAVTPASYTITNLTVNSKGLITAASSSATTGTGAVVLATSPTLLSSMFVPVVYGGTAANSTLIMASTNNGAPSGDTATVEGSTVILRASTGTSTVDVGVANATGGVISIAGGASGAQVWKPAAAASGTITFPAGTIDFSASGGASQVVKQTSAGGIFTVGQLTSADITGLSAGVYAPVMSATPTQAGTGFTTAVNSTHVTPVVTDGLTGVSIVAASNGGAHGIYGLAKAAPSGGNKTATALFALNSGWLGLQAYGGFGYYDGTKIQMLVIDFHPGATGPLLDMYNLTDKNTFNSSTGSAGVAFVQTLLWMRLVDDGTNVHFATSVDGVTFIDFLSVVKSTGFLGATGYTNVIFGITPFNAKSSITLMSYAET